MTKPVTGQSAKQTKQDRRRDRREEQRRREEERKRAAKRLRLFGVGGVILLVAIIAASFYYFGTARNSQAQTSTNATPNTAVNPAYPPVDNISCDTGEHNDYHVHAHLSLYINGNQVQLPQNLGIATDGSCFYWLHTHDTSGVIHIEAPSQQTYTLGTLFKVWSEEFPQFQYPTQLDNASGWKAYVNGKPYNGDFHKLPLEAHALITLAYQSPNAPIDTVYNWDTL